MQIIRTRRAAQTLACKSILPPEHNQIAHSVSCQMRSHNRTKRTFVLFLLHNSKVLFAQHCGRKITPKANQKFEQRYEQKETVAQANGCDNKPKWPKWMSHCNEAEVLWFFTLPRKKVSKRRKENFSIEKNSIQTKKSIFLKMD